MNKFRAWDSHRGKMFTHQELAKDQLALLPDGSGFWNIDSVSTRNSVHLTHLVPLEYIGERDSNGLEICEGDVIIWGTTLPSFSFLVQRTHCGWNPFIDDCQTDRTWHYIIQGNIFENPELREKVSIPNYLAKWLSLDTK